MKPGFALSLSYDGICLLQRAAGGWRSIGDVSLEATDLAAELAGLRDKALAYGAEDLTCKVIVPNDQIRYLSIDTASGDDDARDAVVRLALEGATPYAVDDLAYDISQDGAITHVAAVAKETLAEAEAFAVEHGFNPVSFVAIPDDNPFLGEPFFGPAAHATSLPGPPKVEPDGIAVVVIGPAIPPASSTPVSEHKPQAETEPLSDTATQAPAPAEQTEAGPTDAGPAIGFSSRRKPREAPKAAKHPAPADSGARTPTLGGAKRGAPPPAMDKHPRPAPVASKSLAADADQDKPVIDDPVPVPPPSPESVSVTAPTLDIPDTDAPVSRLGSFLSRRKSADPAAPVPVAPPTGDQFRDPAPVLSAGAGPENPGFISPTPAKTVKEEAARLTVFGARDQQKIGGKPKHFGLMLAAILLLFLAAVAAWASIFLDNGVAGLFRATPAKTEVAAVPDTPRIGEVAQNPVLRAPPPKPALAPPAPQIGQQEPTTLALLPPASIDIPSLPPPSFVTQAPVPASPDLTDTDSAVLDALRQVAEPQAEPTTEAATEPTAESTAESPPEPAAPGAFVTTGLQQTAPKLPETPSIIGLDNLYIASIDRTDLSQDAVALPTVASLMSDLPLGAVRSPLAAGTQIKLGPRGLVEATTEGALNPGGIFVYLGRPPAVPPTPPAREGDIAVDGANEIAAAAEQISKRRPRARPTDLAERLERSNLGGMSRAELQQRRPKARPQSSQEQADPGAAPTALAVVSSQIPRARPNNFAAIVSAALRPATPAKPDNAGGATAAAPRQKPAPVPQTAAPNIPSSASVARQATLKNELNLRRVNLIGVYGTPSNRRALVRLPSGRYKKVKVGDSVDGGRVVAIGESQLRYQKKGRNLTLKMPSG